MELISISYSKVSWLLAKDTDMLSDCSWNNTTGNGLKQYIGLDRLAGPYTLGLNH